MDKIIGYNHTFSSTNIKPAFYDVESIGGTLYYTYYFVLYPTGLAIVLAVPNELASISYNPTTNYFTTADSLSNGMVKLASITPKIYQFVGASQILVSAGSGSNTRSNSSDNAHYKGYFTTPNPISLNTSSKRIVGQGTEYGSLPEILFIDPALGIGQSLPTNDVDTIRYPLYKKDNKYYKSTSVRQSNAQYLSTAGDVFSHSQEYIDLNQDGTRCYASKNKLGILLNTTTPNPAVPSNNSIFTAATDSYNTKDKYQGDDQRYMTEKYGVKENTNGYQLSFAPNTNAASGYQINHICHPASNCSRNNPGILFRNDEGTFVGTSIDSATDVFGIDQFVIQIKNTQFKIPVGGSVHHYTRSSNNLQSITSTLSRATYHYYDTGGTNPYITYTVPNDSKSPCIALSSHSALAHLGDTVLDLINPTNLTYGRPIITFNTPSYSEYYWNNGQRQSSSTTGAIKSISAYMDLSLQFKYIDSLRRLTNRFSSLNVTYNVGYYKPSTETNVGLGINIRINVPIIPGIENTNTRFIKDNNQHTDSSLKMGPIFYETRDGLVYGSSVYTTAGQGKIKYYNDRKPQTTGYTSKKLLEILYDLKAVPGIVNATIDSSFVSNPTFTEGQYYPNSSHSTTQTYTSDGVTENYGNISAFSAHIVSSSQSFVDYIVAYPES